MDPHPRWTVAERKVLRTIIWQVTQDNQKMDWRTIEELYKREVQKLGYPDRSMDGLKGQWSRMNEAMQQVYLPQVNHDTFVALQPGPYTFATDSYQTSLFPNMPMAQATTPNLGAAIQSPYLNFHSDMAYPTETDPSAYLPVQIVSTGPPPHMAPMLKIVCSKKQRNAG
jgi:hypothetical protein